MWLAEPFPLHAPDPQVSLITKPCSCFLIDLTWCGLPGLCVLLPALWMRQLCSPESQRWCWPSPDHGWGPCGSAGEGCLWKQFASRCGMQKPLESALFKSNPLPPPCSRLQHRLIQMLFVIRRKEALSVQKPPFDMGSSFVY